MELRIRLDKIASVTRNVRLQPDVTITPTIDCRAGSVIAVRVLGEKSVYNQLEDLHGRMSTLHDGDIIAGALGHRNALQGYTGIVPTALAAGDTVQILNLGGVLGHCHSHNPEVGQPFSAEVLGSILTFPEFQSRVGIPAHIGMNAIAAADTVPATASVIFVAGTCMNAGKTYASCQLIKHFSRRGLRVAGCKLTGVSLLRDALSMVDYGAERALTFNDTGIVTTDATTAVPATRTILTDLMQSNPDVIVAELGDGILGEYGVQSILSDPAIKATAAALILCANDPVGARGGVDILRSTFGWATDVLSGPATDNDVGCRFVERELGIPALNARSHGTKLAEFLIERLQARRGAAS